MNLKDKRDSIGKAGNGWEGKRPGGAQHNWRKKKKNKCIHDATFKVTRKKRERTQTGQSIEGGGESKRFTKIRNEKQKSNNEIPKYEGTKKEENTCLFHSDFGLDEVIGL